MSPAGHAAAPAVIPGKLERGVDGGIEPTYAHLIWADWAGDLHEGVDRKRQHQSLEPITKDYYKNISNIETERRVLFTRTFLQ